jgi:hypothetical protein
VISDNIKLWGLELKEWLKRLRACFASVSSYPRTITKKKKKKIWNQVKDVVQ